MRGSAALLAAGGAHVDLRVLPPGEHGIADEEVDALRALLTAPAAGS